MKTRDEQLEEETNYYNEKYNKTSYLDTNKVQYLKGYFEGILDNCYDLHTSDLCFFVDFYINTIQKYSNSPDSNKKSFAKGYKKGFDYKFNPDRTSIGLKNGETNRIGTLPADW